MERAGVCWLCTFHCQTDFHCRYFNLSLPHPPPRPRERLRTWSWGCRVAGESGFVSPLPGKVSLCFEFCSSLTVRRWSSCPNGVLVLWERAGGIRAGLPGRRGPAPLVPVLRGWEGGAGSQVVGGRTDVFSGGCGEPVPSFPGCLGASVCPHRLCL